MYISPTLPAGGGWWPIQALAHSRALASMHIGSGPGVVGLSAMQVKPLVPLRTTRIAPLASTSMTVDLAPTAAGAADMALATSALSDMPVFIAPWPGGAFALAHQAGP